MSGHIDYALSRINREIPRKLLNLAFAPESRQRRQYISVDENIRQKVIRSIVNEDDAIVAGTVEVIDLSKVSPRQDENGYIYDITPAMTGGRDVISLMSLEREYYGASGDPNNMNSTAVNGAYLIGPNSIMVTERIYAGALFARCVLANDEQMSNMPQTSKYVYGQLAVLAAKIYIYNELSLGVVSRGMSESSIDGRTRQLIDSYADSVELYDAMLKQWVGISAMSDRRYHRRFIRATINPYG